jgi:hypothetical protein
VLTPVAHASPDDGRVMERLARWRRLYDPRLSDEELLAGLASLGADAFVVDRATESLHRGLHPFA